MFIWPLGLGRISIIFSKISSTPSPVLPEQGTEFFVSIPITSSICLFDLSKSDAGKSILFKIGIISWFESSAWYTFANVCASTPCVLSTINIDPSHA